MGLLLLSLAACSSAPRATGRLGPTVTTSPVQAIAPTAIPWSTDLAFANPLVELLRGGALTVLSVRSSVYDGMFQSTYRAAWIETDRGIVEAVFFADPAEVEQIRVTPVTGEVGRYIYKIQAPAPTLSHDVTIDAGFPLYFTLQHSMFLVTSNAELDETLKRILPGQ
jgi:hypothetical protein